VGAGFRGDGSIMDGDFGVRGLALNVWNISEGVGI